MELLSNLLLNQFAGNNSATNLKSESQSDFSQFFTQASNKNNQNNYNQNNDTSKDKKYDNSSKDDKKYDNSKKDSNKDSSTSDTKKTDDKSTKSKDDTNKVKSNDNIILIDQTMLTEIAQVLDIPVDKVLDTLSELSMSISMLQDSENLLEFVQSALDITDSKDLLFVDDLSEILDDLTQIAEGVNFTDIGSASSVFQQFLNKEDLQNLTVISDDVDAQTLTQIKELLSELNGEVVETKISKKQLNLELLEEELQEEALNQATTSKENSSLVPKLETSPKEKLSVFLDKVSNLDISKDLSQDLDLDLDLSQDLDLVDASNLSSSNQQQSQQQSQQQQSSSSQQVAQATQASTSESNILGVDATFNLGGKVSNSSLVASSQTTSGMTSNQVMAQILDKMRESVQQDVTEVKITLKPAHLGDLTLKIISEEGTITAQFLAENEKIKELIEANFESLKDLLTEQGIDVGALEVNVSDKEPSQDDLNYQASEVFKHLQENELDDDLLASLLQEEQEEKIILDENSSISYSV